MEVLHSIRSSSFSSFLDDNRIEADKRQAYLIFYGLIY